MTAEAWYKKQKESGTALSDEDLDELADMLNKDMYWIYEIEDYFGINYREFNFYRELLYKKGKIYGKS